jgi:uncharacterized membrane protein
VFNLKISEKILLIIIVIIGVATLLWLGRNQVYEFLYTFFIFPLGHSYNPINSAVYAIMLLVGLYLLSRILPHLKVEVNGKFVISLFPFIILGSCLRVFQDSRIIDSVFLVSPLIYLLVFVYTFSCLLLSILIAKKTNIRFYFPFFLFGIVPAAYVAFRLVLNIVNIESLVLTLFFGAFFCLIAFLVCLGIHRIVKFANFGFDVVVVFSQMIDVSATYVGVSFYGYGEQHFLVKFIVDALGSVFAFYLLDFSVIVAVLLVLERILRKEPTFLDLFRLTLLVLGLAPAIRDILRVAMLT